MSIIRLFFSAALSADMIDKLDKSQSHYLTKVMRIKENEVFSLFNKNGEWEAKVLEISKNKYKSFNTKIKKLNDNRKNNNKIIDKRKKENNNLRKEISKLEDKFVKLKQY